MVSSVLGMSAQELANMLADFHQRFAEDPEYQELRSRFPEDWPM